MPGRQQRLIGCSIRSDVPVRVRPLSPTSQPGRPRRIAARRKGARPMTQYLRNALKRTPATTPQREPLDSAQVPNSAGGYAYPVDDWTRLTRWLVLGSEGGSYYATERA